jgi:hypothetical protein
MIDCLHRPAPFHRILVDGVIGVIHKITHGPKNTRLIVVVVGKTELTIPFAALAWDATNALWRPLCTI